MTFDGTIASLVNAYLTDPDSTFHKGVHCSRVFNDNQCVRIVTSTWTDPATGVTRDIGSVRLSEVKARAILRWHENWSAGGHVSMGRSLIGTLRTITGFGKTILEDAECRRVSELLSAMRFEMGKPRTTLITTEQIIAIRARAHEVGYPSIALAQAFQFECMFRQKDIIGEWVPMNEPDASDITLDDMKWLRGLRWEEIDDNLILRHVTSKRRKLIEVDLNLAPMVLEEFKHLRYLGTHGPIIITDDEYERPWVANQFRREWRKIARACDVSDDVFNMDTRASSITEATEAGADLEHIKHAAAHSDIAMTQRYARGSEEKGKGVLIKRVTFRNSKAA